MNGCHPLSTPRRRAGRAGSSGRWALRRGGLAGALPNGLGALGVIGVIGVIGMGLMTGCASSPAPVYLTLPGLPLADAPPGSVTAGAVAQASGAAAPASAPGNAPATVPVMAPVTSAATSAALAPVLAVRRVTIPEYMVTRRVRYRAEPSTLAEWPNTFWGERIELGVSREFVDALRQQLPRWTLCDTHCDDQNPALSLQLDLLPMDYLRSARTLQARARVTLSSGGAVPRLVRADERAYQVAAADDTPQGQAQAIAELVRRVAHDIAPLVLAAPAPQPSAPTTQEPAR